MINKPDRFWAPAGWLEPGGPSSFHISDWDQRRTISVTMCGEHDDEAVFIEHLRRHVDSLGPKVYQIEVSEAGELNSVSSNPEDDETLCPHYPPLRELERPDRVGVISRSELEELHRFGPNVDLVSYAAGVPHDDGRREDREAVFKYYFHMQFMHQRWDEMNVWMRLPPHPNIVPFDRLVVDELNGQQLVVGFTSLYIHGGTLDKICTDPTSRVFKLKWLLQLTSLVDDLNLRFGIQHQDLAPRNLAVDEATDNIMLFDFNVSARIGGPLRNSQHVYFAERNDVKGLVFTLYEILTQDYSFRSVPYKDRYPSSVLDSKDWTKHPDVRLDHPLKDYRAALDTWLKSRNERDTVSAFTDAPEYIDWPPLQEPSCFPHEDPTHPVPGDYAKPESEEYAAFAGQNPPLRVPRWVFNRRTEWESNRQVIEWERPASSKMREGICLFADGRIVESPLKPSRWMHSK